jgi:demethylmenaquinone methyltransferase / 2-methoxy-6-polyprenyl-1,4-benzoquinol methylase
MNAVENSASETTTDDLPAESGGSEMPAQVDKSGDRIQKMFGEISGRYDFLNHFLSGGVDYYWRWRTVRRIRPEGDSPILDVCTGTGDLAIAYWKKAHGQAAVVGTDFTPEMLVIARQKSAKLGIAAEGDSSAAASPATSDSAPGDTATLTFIEADTMQLPLDSNLFQIVSVAFGLRNVSDTVAGLKEITRVCRPGGQVAVLEFSMPRNRLFGAVYRWYFRNILPRIGQLLARNSEAAYKYLPQSVSQFPQDEELAGLMREAGLTDITWTPLTFGIATLYAGRKPAASES